MPKRATKIALAGTEGRYLYTLYSIGQRSSVQLARGPNVTKSPGLPGGPGIVVDMMKEADAKPECCS